MRFSLVFILIGVSFGLFSAIVNGGLVFILSAMGAIISGFVGFPKSESGYIHRVLIYFTFIAAPIAWVILYFAEYN